MERTDKRRLDRERQKLDKQNMKEDQNNKLWFSQLPVSRKIFIGKFIERRTIENDNLVAMVMDKCILGAMDDDTSIDLSLMKKVIKDSNEYILDYKEYLDKEKQGGFDMIENDKIRNEVKEIMKSNISKGISKVKCMAWCKKEFNLPAAELSDMWVKCKEEYMTNIVDEIKKIPDTKAEEEKSALEVVEEIKVIKGKYGFYHKSNDGIRFSNDIKLLNDDIAYETKDEVLHAKTNMVNDINKDILILEEKLESLKRDRDTVIDKYLEFERVFDM